ncbi:MAG: hypothetical protein ABIU63_13135 [Chitinophagaceae bacterium]
MKNYLIAGLLGLLLISCKKDNEDARQILAGQWELRQSAGGIAGVIDYPAGNGFIIEFSLNNKFRYIYPANANAIERSGMYEIKKSSSAGNWLLTLQYNLNNAPVSETSAVQLDNKKLVFLPKESCCDVPSIAYEHLP